MTKLMTPSLFQYLKVINETKINQTTPTLLI